MNNLVIFSRKIPKTGINFHILKDYTHQYNKMASSFKGHIQSNYYLEYKLVGPAMKQHGSIINISNWNNMKDWERFLHSKYYQDFHNEQYKIIKKHEHIYLGCVDLNVINQLQTHVHNNRVQFDIQNRQLGPIEDISK